jgi:four helix bundle protein
MAANYRAVGRARSRAEFVSKLAIVIEEADETVFCLELLADSAIVSARRLGSMKQINCFLSFQHREGRQRHESQS